MIITLHALDRALERLERLWRLHSRPGEPFGDWFRRVAGEASRKPMTFRRSVARVGHCGVLFVFAADPDLTLVTVAASTKKSLQRTMKERSWTKTGRRPRVVEVDDE